VPDNGLDGRDPRIVGTSHLYRTIRYTTRKLNPSSSSSLTTIRSSPKNAFGNGNPEGRVPVRNQSAACGIEEAVRVVPGR